MMRRITNTVAGILILLLAFALIGLPPSAQADNESLDAIHEQIERKYPDVSHIRREALEELPDDTVFFDVRELGEFAVSRIEGAIRVPPDITPDEFREEFGNDVEQKTVVFYCSVGRRSSRLIDRLDLVLTEKRAVAYNLEGSIFRWHNDEAPLVNDAGETERVHPYNWLWSRHLERRSETSYTPRSD